MGAILFPYFKNLYGKQLLPLLNFNLNQIYFQPPGDSGRTADVHQRFLQPPESHDLQHPQSPVGGADRGGQDVHSLGRGIPFFGVPHLRELPEQGGQHDGGQEPRVRRHHVQRG